MPWRGSDHLPTWEASDFGVRRGQVESSRAALTQGLARVVVADPDGTPLSYVRPLMVVSEPEAQDSRSPGLDGRQDGLPETFLLVPGAPGTYVPARATHYGRRRFRPIGPFADAASGVTVDVPFQGVGDVRITTLE